MRWNGLTVPWPWILVAGWLIAASLGPSLLVGEPGGHIASAMLVLTTHVVLVGLELHTNHQVPTWITGIVAACTTTLLILLAFAAASNCADTVR